MTQNYYGKNLLEETISESEEQSRGDGLRLFDRSVNSTVIGRLISAATRSHSSTAEISPNITPNRFASFSPSAALTCLEVKFNLQQKIFHFCVTT